MFLSKKAIKTYVKAGKISIKPRLSEENIKRAGIRLHLHKTLFIPFSGQQVDLVNPAEIQAEKYDLSKQPFHLGPGRFVLGHTYEKIKTPSNIIGYLDGRSSLARLGMTVHISSCIADGLPEEERLVLEIKNLGPHLITLRYKAPVAMLSFMKLTE